LFITSKLWIADLGYDSALRAYDATLSRLGLESLDLYLIHWPAPATDRYLQSWRALESLYNDGRVRAIGVSNFLSEHLQRLVDTAAVLPAINQIELHPALQNRETVSANDRFGIATQAWSPLAQGAVLQEDTIVGIAARIGHTPAQVVLRWHLQHGRMIIPKSTTPIRIAENIALFDFELSDQDMGAIDALDRDRRTGPDPATFNG
jgi:2,5-diketo-D-gluconate reductase A